MKLHCEHEIPLSADAFWDVLHAPRYEALVAEGANLHEYRELERRDEGDAIYRRLLGRPELPAALTMLVARIAPEAGMPSYVEEQWRSKSRMEVRWRMQPSVLPDRSRIEGTLRVEPLDAERCRRVLDGVVEVDLFGIGRLVEKAVVSAVVDAYARAALAVRAL
jgi:hypothetical protein